MSHLPPLHLYKKLPHQHPSISASTNWPLALTPTSHTYQSCLAWQKLSSTWTRTTTLGSLHVPSHMDLSLLYATKLLSPNNTSKKVVATSIHSMALSSSKRLKYTAFKHEGEMLTCHQHLSEMEGEWTYKCLARVRRISSLNGSRS